MMYSSVTDLYRVQRALLAGTILAPSPVAQMFTPSFSLVGTLDGVFHEEAYYPASRTTVVVLSNLSSAPADLLDHIQSAIISA